MQYSPQGFGFLPSGVKNLLIVNVLVFAATFVFRSSLGIDLEQWLSLYAVQSPQFGIWQYLTYQFMHANFDHIFFNMFALWMFGTVLENAWGTKRFLLYYLICGIGAGIIHTIVNSTGLFLAQEAVNAYAQAPSPDAFISVLQSNFKGHYNTQVAADFIDSWRTASGLSATTMGEQSVLLLQQLVESRASVPTVGASGAVYGILLAFGMLFPNERIYLYFLVPIKAKWFVIGYGAIELFEGIFRSTDGIAHFAHLGGMLFGLILILYWRKNQFTRWN